jgi:hypothetical protein
MRIAGRGIRSRLNREPFSSKAAIPTSSPAMVSMGRSAWSKGISRSLRGSEAISDMRRVVTRSVISSSPGWRFPMIRMMSVREAYMMTVRNRAVSMAASVFGSVCPFFPPFIQKTA